MTHSARGGSSRRTRAASIDAQYDQGSVVVGVFRPATESISRGQYRRAYRLRRRARLECPHRFGKPFKPKLFLVRVHRLHDSIGGENENVLRLYRQLQNLVIQLREDAQRCAINFQRLCAPVAYKNRPRDPSVGDAQWALLNVAMGEEQRYEFGTDVRSDSRPFKVATNSAGESL